MRSLVALLVFISGCDGPCATATPIVGCTSCAPGDVRRGVLVNHDDVEPAVASSPSGEVAWARCGYELSIVDASLDPAQAVDATLDIAGAWSTPRIVALSRAPDGAVATLEYEDVSDDEGQAIRSVLVLHDASGEQRWTRTLEVDEDGHEYYAILAGDEHVFALSEYGGLFSYSRATGQEEWRFRYQGQSRREASMALGLDGGVVVGGSFAQKLEVFPSGPRVESTGRHGFVLVHRPNGAPQAFYADEQLPVVEVNHIAIAPDGSIAIHGNDGLIINDAAQSIALLAPDGTTRWSHGFGRYEPDVVTSIATDGTSVVAAGYGRMTFSPDGPRQDGSNGFLVSLDASGLGVIHVADGFGDQRMYVDALPAPDSAIAHITIADPTAPAFAFGGVRLDGNGVAIVDVVR